MSIGQRVVLTISFLLLLVTVLFPPWIFVYSPSSEVRHVYVRSERPAGYHLLTGTHIPQDQTQLLQIFNLTPEGHIGQFVTLQSFSTRIDTTRLLVQIFAVLLLTAILYVVVRTAKPL